MKPLNAMSNVELLKFVASRGWLDLVRELKEGHIDEAQEIAAMLESLNELGLRAPGVERDDLVGMVKLVDAMAETYDSLELAQLEVVVKSL